MTITNYEKTLKICKIVVHSSKSIQIKIVKSSLVNQIKNGSRGGTVMKDMQNWKNLATLVVVIFHTELFYDPRFFSEGWTTLIYKCTKYNKQTKSIKLLSIKLLNHTQFFRFLRFWSFFVPFLTIFDTLQTS